MKKLLLIVGAVCALGLFTATAEAGHGCRPGYGYRGPGHGHGHRFDYGYRGHDRHRGHGFFAPRRSHFFHDGHRRRFHHHRGSGLHIGGRRFRLGIHF